MDNWVTTSMARNSAKVNWTLEELGRRLHGRGDIRQWDGLLGWFLDYVRVRADTMAIATVRQWARAAKTAAAQGPTLP